MIDPKVIHSKWSFLASDNLFLACSGGVDSIVLCDLFAPFCKNLTLLHVNYQLRGDASDSDEELVKSTAKKYNFACKTLRVDLKKLLEEKAGNLQEMAREIRFKWFAEMMQQADYLLLAHHEDDQIETFFQHLARKSGIRGLACMKEQDQHTLRPLLTYSKEEIYQFAKEKNLSWNEDQSNQENNYTRNKLRNNILPFLYEHQPEIKESVILLIRLFQEKLNELEQEIKPIYESILKNAVLSFEDYKLLSEEHLVELWRCFGFNANQCKQIEALLQSQKGKKVSSSQFALIREKDYFSITAIDSLAKSFELKIEPIKELPAIFNKNIIYLDSDKIIGNLRLENWKTGDRIFPLGMNGSKLISDLLTESGIPNSERNQHLILRDDEYIHWCIGLKIGRMAVAKENSPTILKISIETLNSQST